MLDSGTKIVGFGREAAPLAIDNKIELEIVGKNVRSLQAGLRKEDLLTGLRTITRDILLLSEKWREKKQERWKTENEHTFCGAGGVKVEQGVATLLHRCWARDFSERRESAH